VGSERNGAFGREQAKIGCFVAAEVYEICCKKMSNGSNVVETCVMNYTRNRRALYKITPVTSGVHLTAVTIDNVTGTFLLKHQQHSLGLA
jgi:hypothetical protein